MSIIHLYLLFLSPPPPKLFELSPCGTGCPLRGSAVSASLNNKKTTNPPPAPTPPAPIPCHRSCSSCCRCCGLPLPPQPLLAALALLSLSQLAGEQTSLTLPCPYSATLVQGGTCFKVELSRWNLPLRSTGPSWDLQEKLAATTPHREDPTTTCRSPRRQDN